MSKHPTFAPFQNKKTGQWAKAFHLTAGTLEKFTPVFWIGKYQFAIKTHSPNNYQNAFALITGPGNELRRAEVGDYIVKFRKILDIYKPSVFSDTFQTVQEYLDLTQVHDA